MASDGTPQTPAGAMDVQAHERNYEGFLKVLKRSTIAVAIVAAIVVFIISH